MQGTAKFNMVSDSLCNVQLNLTW